MAEDVDIEAKIPSHIPASRVYDFDFYNDPLYAQKDSIHDVFLHLSQNAPGMFWTPRNGGHWVLTEQALVYKAFRDAEVFSSERQAIPPMPVELPLPPITTDPPNHTQLRAPLNKAFSPKSMMALSNDVRTLAAELIDKVANRGECDFLAEVAEPLPVLIFMKLMGMPMDRLAEFREWVHDTLANTPAREVAYANVAELMSGLIEERLKEPKDDLISRLVEFEVDGEKLSQEMLLGYCQLLFIAGLDTVVNAMCFAIRHMSRNPELQDLLRAQPQRIPDAVEEMLRRYSLTMPNRRVAKDTTWNGVEVRAEERALMCVPAANIDAKAFSDPTEYKLDREDNVHIAFGAGIHRCAGSHLARIELQILYDEWLKRIPTFRPDPDKRERYHGANVLSIDYLPIVWDVKA